MFVNASIDFNIAYKEMYIETNVIIYIHGVWDPSLLGAMAVALNHVSGAPNTALSP